MHKLMVVGLAATFALAACKSEDKSAKPAEKKVSNEKPKDKPKDPPPAPLTGEALGKHYVDCMGALSGADWAKFQSSCLEENIVASSPDSGMPDVNSATALLEERIKPLKVAFPDLKVEPQMVFVSGRTIASIDLMTGTHDGPLKGPMGEIPATKKKVGLYMAHVIEMSDANKAAKVWVFQDGATMMAQLGLSPAPARAAVEKGLDGAPMIVVAADNDAEKANKALFDQGVEAFNKHDIKAWMGMLGEGYVERDQFAPEDMTDLKKMEKGMKEFYGGFSDIKISISNAWPAGDWVVSVGVMTGTNDGDLPSWNNMKKTGKSVTSNYIEFVRFKDGKLAETWRIYNGMAWLMQLGMVPPPGGEMKKDK